MEIKRDLYLDKLIQKKDQRINKNYNRGSPVWEIIFAEPNFYNHLLQSGVPEDYIIRFAFDSVDDLHLIGESLIDLQEGNNKINPEKFMNYIRS